MIRADIQAQKAGKILQQEKKELREKMRKLRDEIPEETRASEDKILSDMVLQTELYTQAKWILTYVSFGSEVDTHAIIQKSIRDNKRVFVPCIKNGSMDFYEIGSMKDLKPGTMGIPEPDPNPAKKFPYEIHLSLDRAQECAVFVPGLAFDSSLHRIGYGGGYFDRFLSKFRKKMAIGLCYSEQVVESVPAGDLDETLDLVVTPTGAFF